MKRLFIPLVLMCSLAYAAPKDTSLIAKAKTTAAYNLKDPDSAKFRDMTVIRGVVCGQINAKNSMGGYVGFKRFLVAKDSSLIDDDSKPFDQLWSITCQKNPPKPAEPPAYYEESWKDLK